MPRLVLVGGGHAHAEVLRRLGSPSSTCAPTATVTLISPAPTSPYSGMLPGVLEGLYRAEEAALDVAALAAAIPGGRFLCGRATAVDTAKREVWVEEEGGAPGASPPTRVPYDVVSLDVGAGPGWGGVTGAEAWATPVKPVATLLERVESVLAWSGPSSVAVVGGGAGGVEVAAALAARPGGSTRVTLVCGGRLLPGAPGKAMAAVAARLAAAGVAVVTSPRVVRVEPDAGAGGGGGGVRLTLSDDAQLSVAACLWCTGAAAPAWLGAGPSPPRLTPDGFVAVGGDLASPADPSLFAAGDCAAVLPHPRPKAGVFAVRQGPALTENLLAALAGRAPREFTPQATALSLLSLGWRSGVGIVPVARLSSTPLVVQGRWVWAWKDWIDRRFVRRYQR